MIRETKDGRTIREGLDYTVFRRWLHEGQNGKCKCCGRTTSLESPIHYDDSFHVAHRGSRGMGGSFRDDRVGDKRGMVECGKCGKCHRKEHNQQ